MASFAVKATSGVIDSFSLLYLADFMCLCIPDMPEVASTGTGLWKRRGGKQKTSYYVIQKPRYGKVRFKYWFCHLIDVQP